jgi:hypothetical protein
LFLPNFGASLNILKVELGSDDQTTDGSEASHMRSQGEVDCHRGYEWELMKQATRRNPSITLYGLPWAWPGFLGFGTNDPYTNVTATAEYVVRWIECARDAHGLNVSIIGLWNEEPGPVEYILALRARLDASAFRHVRIIAPDGGGSGIDEVARAMAANESLKAATWGLGSHYPGAGGTSDYVRAAGVPLWAAEDYSTYSDATGCSLPLPCQGGAAPLRSSQRSHRCGVLGSFARAESRVGPHCHDCLVGPNVLVVGVRRNGRLRQTVPVPLMQVPAWIFRSRNGLRCRWPDSGRVAE